MRKDLELSTPTSCLNKARPDQFVFVLVDHDVTMPATIRDWCKKRIEAGKNTRDDAQITEALELADKVELQQTEKALKESWPYSTTVAQVCEIVKYIMQVDKVESEIIRFKSGRVDVQLWINGKDSPDAILWKPTFEVPTNQYFHKNMAQASMDLMTLIGFVCDHVQSMSIPKAIRERDVGILYALAWEVVELKTQPQGRG